MEGRYQFILMAMLCSLALAGCRGESVKIIFPPDHPAHPMAAEAPWTLPPDPFAPPPAAGANASHRASGESLRPHPSAQEGGDPHSPHGAPTHHGGNGREGEGGR